jgi:histidinol-phosphate aminotransferase
MSAAITRRMFVGGFAAAVTSIGMQPGSAAAPQSRASTVRQPRPRLTVDEYNAAAKLAYNENPYGPSEPVVKAMIDAFRFDNRYGYPDGNIQQEIAAHHGVQPENVLLGAGSSEILQAVGRTFLQGRRKVVGVEPTFGEVYEYASGIRAESIVLPLREDYRQDIGALIRAARDNHRDVGLFTSALPTIPRASS